MTGTLYVESSALVQAVTGADASIQALLSDAPLVTSALTILETARAIARLRREKSLSPANAREADRRLAAFERSAFIRAIDDEVLEFARRDFPIEHVRSLDAIQLATLVLCDRDLSGPDEGPLTVLCCDRRVRDNATALGIPVLPPAT
jgi:predicted nucleic acid-binding protein